MQGFPPNEDFPPFPPSPNNPSNEETIDKLIHSEVGNVAHTNHQLGGVVNIIENGFLSSLNPPLTGPISPTLVELPSSTLSLHHIFVFCR